MRNAKTKMSPTNDSLSCQLIVWVCVCVLMRMCVGVGKHMHAFMCVCNDDGQTQKGKLSCIPLECEL